MRCMGQEAAYQPGLYLTATQLVAELPASLEEYTNTPSVKEVDDLLVVCVGQMAVTTSNDLLWKPLNHEEPLCGSISSQLRNSLQGLNIASELEQAVQLVTNDKLDLGCALIEQAATEKEGSLTATVA